MDVEEVDTNSAASVSFTSQSRFLCEMLNFNQKDLTFNVYYFFFECAVLINNIRQIRVDVHAKFYAWERTAFGTVNHLTCLYKKEGNVFLPNCGKRETLMKYIPGSQFTMSLLTFKLTKTNSEVQAPALSPSSP